jgi:hypothetical protein
VVEDPVKVTFATRFDDKFVAVPAELYGSWPVLAPPYIVVPFDASDSQIGGALLKAVEQSTTTPEMNSWRELESLMLGRREALAEAAGAQSSREFERSFFRAIVRDHGTELEIVPDVVRQNNRGFSEMRELAERVPKLPDAVGGAVRRLLGD